MMKIAAIIGLSGVGVAALNLKNTAENRVTTQTAVSSETESEGQILNNLVKNGSGAELAKKSELAAGNAFTTTLWVTLAVAAAAGLSYGIYILVAVQGGGRMSLLRTSELAVAQPPWLMAIYVIVGAALLAGLAYFIYALIVVSAFAVAFGSADNARLSDTTSLLRTKMSRALSGSGGHWTPMSALFGVGFGLVAIFASEYLVYVLLLAAGFDHLWPE